MSHEEAQNILTGIRMLISAAHITEHALARHTFLHDEVELREALALTRAAITRLNEEP
jgi:hypothetical protein